MPRRPTSILLLGSLVVLCLGCGDTTAPAPQSPLPQSPPPTSSATSGFIYGYVVDQSGICIRGAMVQIVEGPGTGRKSGQADACAAWDYGGEYEFRDLPGGATVTLRASAPGYRSEDRQVVAENGGPGVEFVLAPE